jgi:hypothetical protein
MESDRGVRFFIFRVSEYALAKGSRDCGPAHRRPPRVPRRWTDRDKFAIPYLYPAPPWRLALSGASIHAVVLEGNAPT